MPPNPPSNAHGFAMRSMSLRDMQIPKSEKKILGPPPPKSWGRPCIHIQLRNHIKLEVVVLHEIINYPKKDNYKTEICKQNRRLHTTACVRNNCWVSTHVGMTFCRTVSVVVRLS